MILQKASKKPISQIIVGTLSVSYIYFALILIRLKQDWNVWATEYQGNFMSEMEWAPLNSFMTEVPII